MAIIISELIEKVNQSNLSSIKKTFDKIYFALQDPFSSATELCTIIESDPTLAAKILKYANSPFFGYERNIGSIKSGVVRLGLNTIKEIALKLKIDTFFNSKDMIFNYSNDLLWEHDFAVALTAKEIFRKELRLKGDDIYAIALLHDLGFIILNQIYPKEFHKILEINDKSDKNMLQIEKDLLGYDHNELAAIIIENWCFPELIVKVIEKQNNLIYENNEYLKYKTVLRISKVLCAQKDIGYVDKKMINFGSLDKDLEVLGINSLATEFILNDVLMLIDTQN